MGHVDLYGESRDDFDVRFANFHVRPGRQGMHNDNVKVLDKHA